MSTGMNLNSGRTLSDMEHIRQSVTKILTTPIGSRIKRRTFGSLFPDLIDQPINDYTVILLYAATATALLQHEPRLRLTQAQLAVNPDVPGSSTLEITGVANINGRRRRVSFGVQV